MELWIRSQDKQCLVKSNNLCIIYNQERDVFEIDSFSGNEDTKVFLADYLTSMRATEVLDEIHQRLINLQCLELNGTDYITNKIRKQGIDCVYEMPEE